MVQGPIQKYVLLSYLSCYDSIDKDRHIRDSFMIINSSLFRYIPYRLKRMLKLNVVVNFERQALTIPTNIDGSLRNIYWKRSWKTDVIERFLEGETGLFIDVGANVGQTLIDLRLVKPGYYYIGFEPNSSCVSYLKSIIQLNSLEHYQVFPIGLSDRAVCLPLFRHKDSQSDPAASIVPNLRPGRLYSADIVPCFNFDAVRKNLALGNIDFIKIDVEGAELETLTGMQDSIAECSPIILCEVLFTDSKGSLSFQDDRNVKLIKLLTSLRYKALQLIKSEDLTHIVDVRPIREFASGYWNQENKELCDYLFFPDKKEAHVMEMFATTELNG